MAQTNNQRSNQAKVKKKTTTTKATATTATATATSNRDMEKTPTCFFYLFCTFFIHNYNKTIEHNALLPTTPCNLYRVIPPSHVRLLFALVLCVYRCSVVSVFLDFGNKSKFINIIYHYSSLLIYCLAANWALRRRLMAVRTVVAAGVCSM